MSRTPRRVLRTLSRISVSGQLLIGTAVVAIVVAGSFGALLSSLGDLRAADRGRDRVDRIIAAASEAQKEVLDIETSVRAFALARDRRFLEPWSAAQARFPTDAAALLVLLKNGNATDDALGEAIERLGDAYVTDYARPLVARISRRGLTASERTSGTADGKRRVDRLRGLFTQLDRLETRQAIARFDAADRAVSRTAQRGLVGLIASLLLIGLFSFGLRQGVARPISRLRMAADKMAAGDLSSRTAPSLVLELDQLSTSFNVMASALAADHAELETRVAERTQDLEAARLELLQRLALAAEFRDDDTHEHTRRVGHNAARIAEHLGFTADERAVLELAAPLHDIGKIGIPDGILLKPGKLTDDERETMKTHTVMGADLLSDSPSFVLRMAEQIALSHHERWDGMGYPHGLREHDIPLVARIVAAADVLDALTHERPYKAAWSQEDAIAEIVAGRASHFDPDVVDALLAVVARD